MGLALGQLFALDQDIDVVLTEAPQILLCLSMLWLREKGATTFLVVTIIIIIRRCNVCRFGAVVVLRDSSKIMRIHRGLVISTYDEHALPALDCVTVFVVTCMAPSLGRR